MKLAANVEWALIVVLIVYIAFTPGFPIVKQFLLAPIGRAVALGTVMYVWKTVSPAVAALLLVSYLRCAPTREGLENPETPPTEKFERSCACPNGFDFDRASKKCTNKKGDFMNPTSCSCGPGMKYNAAKNDCEIDLIETESIVPPAPVALSAAEEAAPAVSTGTAGTAPDISPGAAQAAATSSSIPKAEKFTTMPAEKFSMYYPLN